MKNISYKVPKSEILEFNINWSWPVQFIGAKPEPVCTVDFKIKYKNEEWEKDRIFEGKHLVGQVHVYEVNKE